jgi:hypothetical protein
VALLATLQARLLSLNDVDRYTLGGSLGPGAASAAGPGVLSGVGDRMTKHPGNHQVCERTENP